MLDHYKRGRLETKNGVLVGNHTKKRDGYFALKIDHFNSRSFQIFSQAD